MTSRDRLLKALAGGIPDRLPVTTHHLMPTFLDRFCEGAAPLAFFERFGLDPILWLAAHRPDSGAGHFFCPQQPGFALPAPPSCSGSDDVPAPSGSDDVPAPSGSDGVPALTGSQASPVSPASLEPRWIESDEWRIEIEPVPDGPHETSRYRITTPAGQLQTVLRAAPETAWVIERLIKEQSDIDLIARYAPAPLCDTEAVNRAAGDFGERGIVRGTVPGFDIYGQPGCWQDAAVLVGIEELILATFDDPAWVRTLLDILRERKLIWLDSSAGARFDLLELGGGDASSTVISPAIFEEFVAPWDSVLIAAAHEAGQRVVYHTCGGMMPLLELIAAMEPDAMETFTPPTLGGDSDLAEARAVLGSQVCMIGGFDQARFFTGCSPADTRRAVRACFESAGQEGAYILAPSDHFFTAESALIEAFADEARACIYSNPGRQV